MPRKHKQPKMSERAAKRKAQKEKARKTAQRAQQQNQRKDSIDNADTAVTPPPPPQQDASITTASTAAVPAPPSPVPTPAPPTLPQPVRQAAPATVTKSVIPELATGVIVVAEGRKAVVKRVLDPQGAICVEWQDSGDGGTAYVFADELEILPVQVTVPAPTPAPGSIATVQLNVVEGANGSSETGGDGGVGTQQNGSTANGAVEGEGVVYESGDGSGGKKKRRRRKKKKKKKKADDTGDGDGGGARKQEEVALITTGPTTLSSQGGGDSGGGGGAPPVSLSAAIAPSDPSAERCNVCARTQGLKRCSGCEAVWYCCGNHQKEDWPAHQGMCRMLRKNKRSTVIYGERNSKFVGTFRWEGGHEFTQVPALTEGAEFIYTSTRGWNGFLSLRWPGTWQQEMIQEAQTPDPMVEDVQPRRVVVEGIGKPHLMKRQASDREPPLVVHPSVVDGLSYPMSVIFALNRMHWSPPRGKQLTILMLGATAKTEQRLLENTNYFDEFMTYFQVGKRGGVQSLHYVLVGPELGSKKGGRVRTHTLRHLQSCTYSLVRGTTQDYLTTAGKKLDASSTLAIGYNTGLGSANISLMASWAPGLYHLCLTGITCVWTCANENIDAPGEMRVMQQVIGAKIELAPQACPFRACSTFHAPAMRDSDWSCANCVVYGTRGFKGGSASALATISNPAQLQRALHQVVRSL